MSDKMKKFVTKASFIATGVGFIVAGIYAPESLPDAVNLVLGGIGALLAFLGGWFRKPEAP
jgi:hypothetical protein